MREIKFRAWDKVNKRMGYFKPGFGWNDEYYLWYLKMDGKEDICDVPCEDNIELMQFTDLHDKNGKEIWEGDIVRNLRHTGKVVWRDRLACFLAEGLTNLSSFYLQADNGTFLSHVEVLGNAHENPELLK